MKGIILKACLFVCLALPTLSHAKGIPMFYSTGDEAFAIENAPDYGEGFSLGYLCQHFALFGADIWTWDCEMMAVNMDTFTVADIPESEKSQLAAQFSLSDRQRSFWNQYGVIVLLLGLVFLAVGKMRRA